MTEVSKDDTELNIFAATIYAEARGEPIKGQMWVAWVIKNRAHLNRSYWGGSAIKDVCLQSGQFECWNNLNSIFIDDMDSFNRILSIADQVRKSNIKDDPTNGCDHYNNPKKEDRPNWTRNCTLEEVIHNHHFYKSN